MVAREPAGVVWWKCKKCSWFRWISLTGLRVQAADLSEVIERTQNDHDAECHRPDGLDKAINEFQILKVGN